MVKPPKKSKDRAPRLIMWAFVVREADRVAALLRWIERTFGVNGRNKQIGRK